jgi:hypothetical protein
MFNSPLFAKNHYIKNDTISPGEDLVPGGLDRIMIFSTHKNLIRIENHLHACFRLSILIPLRGIKFSEPKSSIPVHRLHGTSQSGRYKEVMLQERCEVHLEKSCHVIGPFLYLGITFASSDFR